MDFALLVPIVGQFVLRPVQTVLATSKEELDAALATATADQITVEGDDELLSYAVNKAATDPENRVAVEVAGPANPDVALRHTLTEILADHSDQDLEGALAEATMVPTPRPAAPVRATVGSGGFNALSAKPLLRVGKWLLWILAVVGVFLAGYGLFLYAAFTRWPDLLPYLLPALGHVGNNKPAPAPPIAASPPPELPPTPSSDFWANFPSLLWPLVAIVAIGALFLIARQAISSGSNVTIQWKVTEKVSGRVVITKVRERSTKSRAAA
jgi:hypothetical protein